MSYVRFATICDKCGERGPEYCAHTVICRECYEDVCEKCCTTYDPDPPGYAMCKGCAQEMTA